MIQVLPGHKEPSKIYRDVLIWIEDAFGPQEDRHPLKAEDLKLLTRPEEQRTEVDFRNFEKPKWVRAAKRGWNALENKVCEKLMDKGVKFLGVDWEEYSKEVLMFGDHQKFNGMISLTSSTTFDKRQTTFAYYTFH